MSALQKAAEELARIAVQESDNTIVATGKDTVAELRIIHGLLEKSLSASAAQAAAAAAAAKAHSEAVVKAVADAAARAALLDLGVRKDARLQRLQWAINHVTTYPDNSRYTVAPFFGC